MNLRLASRIAWIALALSALWSCLSFAIISITLREPSFRLIAFPVLTLLPELPLFVLLWLLATGAGVPVLSKRQQYIVRALVLIRIAEEIVSLTKFWATIHGTAKLSPSPAHVAFSALVSLLSSVAFIIFLIALSRQTHAPDDPGTRPTLVRAIALTTAIIGGFIIVLGIAVELELMSLRAVGLNRAAESAMVRVFLFGLPGLLAPWIVYSSLRKSYDQIC